MPQNDLQGYLKSVPGSDEDRASTWDAVTGATDQNDFQQKIGKLNIPNDAKVDLWDYKYGNKSLGTFKTQTSTQLPQTNPSITIPSKSSALSRVLGWAQEPLNVGHLRENIENAEQKSNIQPTLESSQYDTQHPIMAGVRAAERGLYGFGADAAKMLASPLGLGMTAASLVPGEGLAASAAKAGLAATGVGFGVQGVKNTIEQPTRQPGETIEDYSRRMLGNAAGIAGGLAGGLEAPHAYESIKAAKGAKAPAAAPNVSTPTTTVAPTPEARIAQAIGNPTPTGTSKTVYVDPEFATHLDQWNQSDLPGKRVKLQTTKAGTTSLKMAHQAPDVPGFQYTNAPEGVSANVSEVPQQGKVPVTLNTLSGNRGTRANGQFLDVQIGKPTESTMPIAGPETPLPAIAAPPVNPTPAPTITTPPVPTQTQFAPQESKIVEPANLTTGAKEVSLPTQNTEPIVPATVGGVRSGGPNPLPQDLSKAAPRYGYGKKNFNLNFQDPADLAAYTYAQDKTNKAQGRFEDYLLKEFPGSTPETLKNYGDTVKSTIKTMAAKENPSDGPLTVPSHRNLVDATGHPESQQSLVEPPTKGFEENLPSKTDLPIAPTQTDFSPIEEKIRPLVGQALNLKRLQTGELASHAIDTAIDNSKNAYGEIPEDVAGKIGKLLGEDVGNRLTDEQIDKLQKLRGASTSEEPKIQYFPKAKAEAIRAGDWKGGPRYAEEFESRLAESQSRMLQALNDPDTSPELRAKIQEAVEPDSKGQMKYALYEPQLEFPRAKDIDPNHIEAPFTSKQLGHEITPISVDNYKAILGKQPRDLLLSTSKRTPFVTDEELAKLKNLKEQASNSSGTDESPGYNPSTLINEVVGNPETGAKGSVFQTEKATGKGSEYETYRRQLYQKVLSRKIASTVEELRRNTNDWNNQRAGLSTELRQQLDKLPPSTRKLLPQELFNEKGSVPTEASSTIEAPKPEQPSQSANTSTSTSTPARTGAGKEASVEGDGLRTNQFERSIEEKYPESAEHAADVRDFIVNRNLTPNLSQRLYDKALQTYHENLEAGDPFALRKAYDVAKAPLKRPQGTMNMSLFGLDAAGKAIVDLTEKLRTKDIYTPEQLHDINYEASSMMLDRWEEMSESELFKKKEGLWKDSLTQRIAQAGATSTDPETFTIQQEHHNELIDRWKALREQVGPSTNLSSRLTDLFTDFADQRQARLSARQTMREVLGTQYRNNAILRQSFDSFDRLVNLLPLPEQDRFFDTMNRGDQINPDLFQDAIGPKELAKWVKNNGDVPHPNDVAKAVRESLDGARNRLTDASGKLEEFFLNYMPGMYENVAAAKNFAQTWAAHRPLQGYTSFLKQRMYEFHADALKAGLTPVTSNPVRASMMRIEQLNRFTMAHEFKNRLIAQGGADWYANDETPPVGHEALNDSLFGQRGIGQYFAPQAVARTFNNFVSQGLTGGWRLPFTNFSLYDALLHTNSMANQMQLGLSWFHATETMLNSGFSSMATGLRQVVNEGKVVRGTGNFLKGATFIAPLVEDAWNGSKGLLNFRDPNQNTQYGQFNSDLERANANVQTKGGFQLEEIEKLKQNWADAMDKTLPKYTRAYATVNAGINALRSTVEATSWPLMNKLVPAVKAGAFYRMADQIHEQYAGQSPEILNLELSKAWDSIDNRFGQVNYDNVFMNKITRDSAKLLVRSPGWNMGTFREVGGGLWDMKQTAYDTYKGKGFQISNRTAYTAAMVMGTMWMNNIYQYLKTGTFPQGVENLFPWDGTKTTQGEKNHVYPKTYVYDAINFWHDPETTAFHKAAPAVSTLSDIIHNQDYYHREIRNPGNSVPENAAATLGYLAHQFLPFSVGNLQESRLRNQKSTWESFAGVLPAPRWATRSNAENLANTYYEGAQGTGAKSDWEMEHQRTMIDLRNQFASGKLKSEDISKAIASGKLSPKSVRYITTPAVKSNLQNWTQHLTDPTQAWNVWEASTPEEKKLLLPTMVKKVSTQFTGEEQQSKFRKLQDYMNNKH